MPTKKQLNSMSEEQYLAELDKLVANIRTFFNNKNDQDMPLLMILPHKYGIASLRIMSDQTAKDAQGPDCGAHTIAYPLTNAIATILDLVKASAKVRGKKGVTQATSDTIAYQVLTVLLAEVLAGDRVDDNLGLAKCWGMRQAISAVEEMHGMKSEYDDEDDEDDEDEDEEMEEFDPDNAPDYDDVVEGEGTIEACIHTPEGGLRGYSLAAEKLTPDEFIEFLELMEKDAHQKSDETAAALENFMRNHGAVCIPTKDCAKTAQRVMRQSKCKHCRVIKDGEE